MTNEWRNENWIHIATALEDLLEQVRTLEDHDKEDEKNALPQ